MCVVINVCGGEGPKKQQNKVSLDFVVDGSVQKAGLGLDLVFFVQNGLRNVSRSC